MYCVKDFVEDVMSQLRGFLPEGGVVHFKMPVKDCCLDESGDGDSWGVLPRGGWSYCWGGLDGPETVIEFDAVDNIVASPAGDVSQESSLLLSQKEKE